MRAFDLTYAPVLLGLLLSANLFAGEPPKDTPVDAPLPPALIEGAKLETIYVEKGTFFEGPTWDFATKKLYFCAFRSFKNKIEHIMRLDEAGDPGKATIWQEKTGGSNGIYNAADGGLLVAQSYEHKIFHFNVGPDGPLEPKLLLDDQTLNQPNDVVEAPNGNIYFTDPEFKTHKSAVFVTLKGGTTKKIAEDIETPNGIGVSPDGKSLYVGNSFGKNWRVYPINADGTLGLGRIFACPKGRNDSDPDGLRVDENGNVWCTGLGGVWCFAPDGKTLGFLPVPEFCSNLTFGGEDNKTLFITCSGKLYAVKTKVRGAWMAGK